MHVVVRLFAVMSIGALSQALATEPEHPASTTPSQAQTSSQPAAAATPADQQPSGAKAAVAAPSTTAATAAPTDAKTAAASGQLSPELIKKAHSMGYKIKHKGQDVYFCRNEVKMGSRFEAESCSRPEELDHVARDTQQMVQKAQRIGMPSSN
jgi:hypothetical protein